MSEPDALSRALMKSRPGLAGRVHYLNGAPWCDGVNHTTMCQPESEEPDPWMAQAKAAMAETPVSVWQGEMQLLGITLHLHVLDDGTRIVEAQDMVALLEAMGKGGPVDEDEVAAFARWQRGADG